jgi:SPP1 family predicted phage head-tail adaptor
MPRFHDMPRIHPPIAAMRHRLAIEAPVDTPDGAGGATRSWTTVALIWAALEPIGNDVRFAAGRPEQATTHRITMRWRSDLDGGKRLRMGTRIFQILACADSDERRKRLVCLCEEVTP